MIHLSILKPSDWQCPLFQARTFFSSSSTLLRHTISHSLDCLRSFLGVHLQNGLPPAFLWLVGVWQAVAQLLRERVVCGSPLAWMGQVMDGSPLLGSRSRPAVQTISGLSFLWLGEKAGSGPRPWIWMSLTSIPTVHTQISKTPLSNYYSG